MSIKLKNWVVRTFYVSLQTSELAGAASIPALSSTIAARSKLISDEIRGLFTQTQDEQKLETTTLVNGDFTNKVPASKPFHGYYYCRGSKELPRYPLVDLDEAVEDLLNDIGHFGQTLNETDNLCKAAQELIAPNSLSRSIYNDLEAKFKNSNVDSWIADFFVKALALKRRYPVAPYINFLATHYDSKVPHT